MALPHQRLGGEDQASATLTGPEPASLAIKDAHLAACQSAIAREAHQLERVKAQVDGADHHAIHIAGLQPVAGRDDSDQRGRTGAVHRMGAAAQTKIIRDPPGDGVGEPAGQTVLVGRGKRLLEPAFELGHERIGVGLRHPGAGELPEPAFDVGPAITQQVGATELTRQGVGDDDRHPVLQRSVRAPVGRQTRQRAIGNIQRQPMRHVGRHKGRLGHDEPASVEGIARDQCGLDRIDAVGVVLAPKIVTERQPLGRKASKALPPVQCPLPQLLRRAGVRKLARGGHYRDLQRHCASPFCQRQAAISWARCSRVAARGEAPQRGEVVRAPGVAAV